MNKIKNEILDTLKRLVGIEKTLNDELSLVHRQIEELTEHAENHEHS